MSQSTEMRSLTTLERPQPRTTAGNAPGIVALRAPAGNDPGRDARVPAHVAAAQRAERLAPGWLDRDALGNASIVSTEWPTSYELYLAAQGQRAFVLGQILASIVEAVGSLARRALERYRQRRQLASAREALRRLDDRTLHDIGIDRSEIVSITAEAMGEAEAQRDRVVRMRRGHAVRAT